jgi:dTDP-4-amino-4,6-dideoxygalactose transaminase
METNTHYRYPDTESVRKMIEGIWKRKYYTNQGPLTNALELKIQQNLSVRNAVVMTNCDIALLITLLALGENSEALVPDCHPLYLKNALHRMGIAENVYHQDVFSGNKISGDALLGSNKKTVFGFHALGNATDVKTLMKVCNDGQNDLVLLSDNHWKSYQSEVNGKFRMVELFSFQQGQLVNGGEGACMVTNDDDLAAKLRNIRSSYGAGKPVEIPFTGNGRMSEIQAGMALLSLEAIDASQKEKQLIKEKLTALILSHSLGKDSIITTGDAFFALRIEDNAMRKTLTEILSQQGHFTAGVDFLLSADGQLEAKHILMVLLNAKKR